MRSCVQTQPTSQLSVHSTLIASPQTINTMSAEFPPEVILQILSYYEQHDPSDVRCRRATLLTTSLVSRAWKHPSQAVLWQTLEHMKIYQMERLASSPACGRYTTKRVALRGEHLGAKTACDVITTFLGVLRGVKTLLMEYMYGYGEINTSIFGLPSLSGLSSFQNGTMGRGRTHNLTTCVRDRS